MDSAASLLHRACGSPVIAECGDLAPVPCWHCGGDTVRGRLVAEWAGASFTGQNRIRCPSSLHICEACVWVMARSSDVPGRPAAPGQQCGPNFRNFSHMLDARGYVNASKGEKPAIRAWLRGPKSGAWFAAIADSGQKHVVPYAPINPAGARESAREDFGDAIEAGPPVQSPRCDVARRRFVGRLHRVSVDGASSLAGGRRLHSGRALLHRGDESRLDEHRAHAVIGHAAQAAAVQHLVDRAGVCACAHRQLASLAFGDPDASGVVHIRTMEHRACVVALGVWSPRDLTTRLLVASVRYLANRVRRQAERAQHARCDLGRRDRAVESAASVAPSDRLGELARHLVPTLARVVFGARPLDGHALADRGHALAVVAEPAEEPHGAREGVTVPLEHDLLERLACGPVSVADAERMTGSTTGALDPDAPVPWEFIATSQSPATLRRAYDVMMARFRET